MQKPVKPAHADHTPALAWARAHLRFGRLPSPAEGLRRLARAPSKIPPKVRLPAAILSVLVLAIAIFVMLFQWNWLRGPIAHFASAQLNREVAISGNLEVHPWSLTPKATVNGLTVGNPAWAGKDKMLELPRLTVQVELGPLIKRQVILPLVEADKPVIHLVRDAGGRANWNFHDEQPARPLKLPPIHHFIIDDGALRLDDAQRKLTFVGAISSNERATGANRGVFTLEGKGLLNGKTNFLAKVVGGPLLRVDPNRPYLFDARVVSGATRATAVGAIPRPFDLGAFSAKIHLSGADLADLYELTGLAFPATPPYDLAAGFGRADAHYALRQIHGRVGLSDLAGSMKVDASEKKPFLSADLASRRLDMADFLAVFGGVPKHTAGRPLSPTQRAQAAKLKAEHRILPDQPLKTDRLKAMDARVDYRAETVRAGKLPVRKLATKVRLEDSVLTMEPLSFVLPQGSLTGMVKIDGRKATPVESVDMRLSGARIETLVPRKDGAPPMEGGLLARAQLTGAGSSVRAAAAAADGAVSVVIPRGQIRQAFAELMGINATKGLFLLLNKSHSETPVRCAVADFKAQNGVLTARRIVFDTGVVLAVGKGQINLRDETVDLRLDGRSKKFRLVRVMAPITMKGRLEAPKMGVELGKAAPQFAIGGLLGALVSPLAAVLPFIDPGLAKDADCASLLNEASHYGAPVKTR